MAGAFLDTNVLLYAAMHELPRSDQAKRAVAIGLLQQDFGISGQVLAEFYANAVGKGARPMSHGEADAWLERLKVQSCVPVDSDLVQSGAALAARYRISYWDGAILAAAHELGAKTLYTEDLNDGQRYGDVTVKNPFKPAAAN
jgi:predicted nucleic acid-binding protein